MAGTHPRTSGVGDLVVFFSVIGIIDAIRRFIQGNGPEYQASVIEASAHGRGVGAALMDEAIRRAREARADALWLYAWQRAPRAIAFYRKCGFRIVGTSVFSVGEHPTDDWIMARPLASGVR